MGSLGVFVPLPLEEQEETCFVTVSPNCAPPLCVGMFLKKKEIVSHLIIVSFSVAQMKSDIIDRGASINI